MSDQESTPAEGEQPAAEAPKLEVEKHDSPKTFDADYVKALRKENAKLRIKAQQAEERTQEFEDAQKSELEKAQAKAAKLEQKAQEAEARLLRFEVANERQVPADVVDFLTGTTREDLEAQADRILTLVKSRNENDNKPDFDGGAREPAPEVDPETGFNDTALTVLGIPKKP